MLKFHEDNGADATMAVYPYEIKNPYGEVVTKEENILEIKEKPITISYVNAGVYALNPSVLNLLNKDEKIDMPELLERLITTNRKVIACPIHEYWIDLGLPDKLDQVVSDFSENII